MPNVHDEKICVSSAGARSRVEAAAYEILYEHRLDALGRVFTAAGLAPVIVKGQAVADLAYLPDEPRVAADVDLLVGNDENAVATCLGAVGYRERFPIDRPFSREFLGERPFLTNDISLPPLVELHRFLDKFIRRPIDYAAIIARSRPAARSGFRYPAVEDLLLLVILHSSVSRIPDEKSLVDIRNLLQRGQPDLNLVAERAATWGLSQVVAEMLKDSARSRPLRTSWFRVFLSKFLQKVPFPGPSRYFLEQLLRHDSPTAWARDITRYAWARTRDVTAGTRRC